MQHLRPLLAGAAVVAALVGAVVYGGVRASDTSGTESQASGTGSRVSDHGSLPTTLVTPGPAGTRAPSTYGYGEPLARAQHGEVLAYTPHRLPYKLLQVPFTITNNGPEAAMYSVYFTVEIGDGADKASYRQVVTSGGLAAHHTVATRATIGNVDKLPAGAIRVTITDVQKRTHSDLPS
ncbi:hypothetical protein TUSST3_42030 [Streptomyces sp. TUS-ST3]|uniref:hypothetical protein n=1 Tax=Streptomyces sp. TUS-ST3 TaxID=3025591 RepID=UPI00235B54B6|nr:hypothetical protein [Streptomyces sp. TUS-ST3]GLP67581.1 hypothetical protein TUSST3_42030 [Streptomyces sp. TUS-ST3]